MNWPRYIIVDHRCYPLAAFKASTLGTARSFQQHWGGKIQEVGT